MMMQPQSAVTMTTLQPQPAVAMPTSSPVQPKMMKHMKVVRGLAIAELVLGSLCVLIGIVLVGLATGHHYYTASMGEGIWCGVWGIVAGALGLAAVGRQKLKRCLMTCHMTFSILGAVFSATLFAVSTVHVFTQYSAADMVFQILLSLLSFASMVVLIISACYCCYLTPGCCMPYASGQTQVIYMAANPQQPVLMQQAGLPVGGLGTQGYVMQGYQPVPQVVQPPLMQVQQAMAPPTADGTPQTKEQEAMASQEVQATSYPPSYSRI